MHPPTGCRGHTAFSCQGYHHSHACHLGKALSWCLVPKRGLTTVRPGPSSCPAEIDAGAAQAGWGAPPRPSVSTRHRTHAVPRLYPEPHRKGQQPRAWPLGQRWDPQTRGILQPSLSPTALSCPQAPWWLHTALDVLQVLGCTELLVSQHCDPTYSSGPPRVASEPGRAPALREEDEKDMQGVGDAQKGQGQRGAGFTLLAEGNGLGGLKRS